MGKAEHHSSLGPRRRRTIPSPCAADTAQLPTAFGSMGWAVPRTEEEVAAAERDLAGRMPALPAVLRDPATVSAMRPPGEIESGAMSGRVLADGHARPRKTGAGHGARSGAPGETPIPSRSESFRPFSPAPLPVFSDIAAGLSRAAREGGKITPQVEERMRRDRAVAERQADQCRGAKDVSHDGQDVR